MGFIAWMPGCVLEVQGQTLRKAASLALVFRWQAFCTSAIGLLSFASSLFISLSLGSPASSFLGQNTVAMQHVDL